ncbi:hypothetical protein DFH08DRAFT_1089596 [Mycena albidolilacea]|uniref:Uncharacterized protein n=1 Tax=Mycena albidolilacea TaxID=1033008 RepID=A0AAD6Z0R3_9AGAR|nr:hypothetical protein DFH08DRAFT_1089596 [Mycena albidolilacea]
MPPLPSPAAADDEYDVIDLNIDDIPDDGTWFPYAEWLPATDEPSNAAPRLSSPQMISSGVVNRVVALLTSGTSAVRSVFFRFSDANPSLSHIPPSPSPSSPSPIPPHPSLHMPSSSPFHLTIDAPSLSSLPPVLPPFARILPRLPIPLVPLVQSLESYPHCTHRTPSLAPGPPSLPALPRSRPSLAPSLPRSQLLPSLPPSSPSIISLHSPSDASPLLVPSCIYVYLPLVPLPVSPARASPLTLSPSPAFSLLPALFPHSHSYPLSLLPSRRPSPFPSSIFLPRLYHPSSLLPSFFFCLLCSLPVPHLALPLF